VDQICLAIWITVSHITCTIFGLKYDILGIGCQAKIYKKKTLASWVATYGQTSLLNGVMLIVLATSYDTPVAVYRRGGLLIGCTL
jgi:hypothetical protein